MKNTFKKFLLAVAIVAAPAAASATTIGTYTYTPEASPFNLEVYDLYDAGNNIGTNPAANNILNDGTTLLGNLNSGAGTGGGGIVFKFTAAVAGLFAVDTSTTNEPESYEGLRISWCTGTALTAICNGEESFIEKPVFGAKLATTFTNAGDVKFLVANWTGVNGLASNLDFRIVAAVPVPAAGLLLLGALGGLGFAGRRRRKAA